MNASTVVDEISLTEKLFVIEIVGNQEQLREVFRLRHQVYCVERGFEAGSGDEETDEFDPQSRHVLLRPHAGGIATRLELFVTYETGLVRPALQRSVNFGPLLF